MHIPKAFKQDDSEQLHELIHQHPLATLICHDSEGINASRIPFILAKSDNNSDVLRAHIAKVNPLWENVDQWVLAMIDQLTAQQEATQVTPWSSSDAPEQYINDMLTTVVGIEVEINSMVGKWKLSQNQPEKNKRGVVSGLSQQQGYFHKEVAALIKTQLDS